MADLSLSSAHLLEHSLDMFHSPHNFGIFLEFIGIQVKDLFIFALRTGVEDYIFVGVEHQLAFIVEVDLDELVVEPEQNGLVRLLPLFYVDERSLYVLVFSLCIL